MGKMEIGGLDEQTRRGIYAAAGLMQENVRSIEEAIEGSCQKEVGTGALTNVVTRFDSLKNDSPRTLESHTCELPFAYELELDPDVLGYYVQVPCVGIVRRRSDGRLHVSSAHIDFLVLRKSSIELVECKQEEWLRKKIGEQHPDWSEVEGGWTCKPYEEWAKARGIAFKVWVGPKHPAIYLQNLTAIYDAKRLPCTDYEVRACETAARLIEKRPQSIADLQNTSAGFTSRVALLMLAQAYAFGPCRSVSIGQQSKFYLFPTLCQAEVYANAVAAEVSERLRSLGELGDETLTASRKDLESGRRRLERVDRYLNGLDLAPTKLVKRLAKAVRQARSAGKSALAVCLTRYHASGNKVPRLPEKYLALRKTIIESYWNRGRVSCQRDACHIYATECERLGIPVAGLTALRKAIRGENPQRNALASGGMRAFQRVRRNTDPRHTSAAPLGYGEIAHIDSTPIDMRMVDSSTGEVLRLRSTFYIAIDGSSGYPLAFVLIFGPSRTEGLAILMRQIVRRHGFLPRTIHVDRGPEKAFFVSIAILADDGGDLLRVGHRQAPADRCAVVEHVDRIAIQALFDREGIDDGSHFVERVVECDALFDRRLPEARQVGGDHAVALRQDRDQVPEHVGGGTEAVEQQDGRGARRSGFAVEDVDPLDIGGAVVDLGGGLGRDSRGRTAQRSGSEQKAFEVHDRSRKGREAERRNL